MLTKGNTMGTLRKLFVLLLVPAVAGFAQHSSPDITAEELKAHVRYLASDELEGRGSGTEGNRKAAQYIAKAFEEYGLKPAGKNGTYFQEFEFVASVKLGPANALVVQRAGAAPMRLTVDEDFRPFGFSANGKVQASAVFAGYGITAPDLKYDDYEGLDVNGKVVIALRYGPDGNDMHSEFYRFTSLRNKARYAREKGAAALIIVDAHNDELAKLSYDQSHATSGIPCVAMRSSVLEQLFAQSKRSLAAIKDSIKASRRPIGFALPNVSISLETDVVKVMDKTANVLGYLEGTDPQLKDEVVVVGAHFDHLGYGGEGSGSLVPHLHEIHNGADDNASGTAGLLELAQRFAATQSRPRTLLFIGFSGEEMGTLGSQYYVNNPFFPLNKTIAMLNMDEIGRLNQNALTVYGTGTSPEWVPLVRKFNATMGADTFALKLVPDGFGPSDHAQFYAKDIPVLFFFTGTHDDYHKPSDDWEKINYEGQERVVRYIFNIANDIVSSTPKPQFTRAASTTGMGTGGDSPGFAVTLGVIPDYGEGTEGMKIGGTRPNGPADKAGLKAGDIITSLAGKKVMNIYDYMGILGELKVGQVVEVEVLRDGRPLKFSVTMQKR
jgi:aminopeptidase YwaD